MATKLFLRARVASPGPQSLEGRHCKRWRCSNGISSPGMVQQQSAVRKILRRDGNGEGRVMFGASIMRRYSLGVLALVMVSGAAAESAPQVTPNGFLVKFDVNVNAPAAKVYDALVGQVGSWWDSEHT